MKIRELKLLYFRNYISLELDFSPSLNVFVGKNANGKTNIIESIFCLALGRSYRTRSDTECIKFGESATCISCTLYKLNKHIDIMLAISSKGKNAKISGIKKTKLTDFVGELNVVLFAPEDLQLVKGSPSLRREFMNREFYQFSKIYYKHYLLYNHLLKQRNSFLKDMRKKTLDSLSEQYLETLTIQLVKSAIFITKERQKFIDEISVLAAKNMENISSNAEHLEIVYKSSLLTNLGISNINDERFSEEIIVDLMMKKKYEDITKGSTKIGPHQDDLSFLINKIDAKTYASQGQNRSIALSLKLSEVQYLKRKTGNYPIFLLDDVLSELDKTRQIKLLESIDKNVQTFITTPSINDIKKEVIEKAKVFYVDKGQVNNTN